MAETYVVIMAGGKGSRLWPLSRPDTPKPFLPVSDGHNMLQKTWLRSQLIVEPDHIVVLGEERHKDAYLKALPNLRPDNLVLEPALRSTGPACALATHHLAARDPENTLLVLSSDHLFEDDEVWAKSAREAVAQAGASDALVTIGAPTESVQPRYGYIITDRPKDSITGPPVYFVDHFLEKPNEETARSVVKQDHYLQNAGMFAWRANYFLDQVRRHFPAAAELIEHPPGSEEIRDAYLALAPISVDYSMLQTADAVLAVEADFVRVDLGDFAALRDLWGNNEQGNAIQGEAVVLDSRNSIIYSDGPHVGVVGMDDIVVIVSGGRVLVCPADRSQEVTSLYKRIEEND